MGARAVAAADLRHEQVYEHGEVVAGQTRAAEINVEADGTFIALQGSSQPRAELKLFSAYDGREQAGTKQRLVHRRLFATLRPVQRAVEEMALEVCGTWQMDGVKRVRIGGDGAAWVLELAEQFPFSEISYHLDRFHLHEHVQAAIGQDTEAYQAVARGIAALD